MMDRRTFLKSTAISALALQANFVHANSASSPAPKNSGKKLYKRIAVEESWMPPELFDEFRTMSQSEQGRIAEPGLASLWGEVMKTPGANKFASLITDINTSRIKIMDEAGIDIEILSLTAPGVQIFDRDKAVAMARFCNDKLAEGIKVNPDRFAALAAVAPQDPKEGAKELDRCIKKLGMKGVMINSHTNGEFLDDPKFWPILEAAEALNVPLYLHPRTPCAAMLEPYRHLPLEGAVWGFEAECGLHALRMILGGVFDQFPNLQVVLGHLGEGITWFLNRIDYQYGDFVLKKAKSPRAKNLKRAPKEYFLDNFYITSSGMNWEDEVMFCEKLMGPDKVLFAVDYPFSLPMPNVSRSEKFPLSDKDKVKFYQTNAQKVFSL